MYKVVEVEHDLGRPTWLKEGVAQRTKQLESKIYYNDSRRNAFWREMQAMIRLRSPHTVHMYGAVTSRKGSLVLVMELLSGGDLRAFLKDTVEPLPQEQTRRIVGDITAGMAFLHHKETIHGDLKSPNVLFDGTGRAKVNHDPENSLHVGGSVLGLSLRAREYSGHACTVIPPHWYAWAFDLNILPFGKRDVHTFRCSTKNTRFAE